MDANDIGGLTSMSGVRLTLFDHKDGAAMIRPTRRVRADPCDRLHVVRERLKVPK